PLSLPLLDLYRPQAPIATIGVDLYRQRGDTTTRIWAGGVGSVEFAGAKAKIHCLAALAALGGIGLKRKWQKACPLALYSAGLGQCNASRSAAKETATISAVSGRVVHAATFAGHADGWWAGGYLEWSDGNITQRRFIAEHVGDAVTLMTPAAPLTAGVDVTALPGCDHTLATCDSKFGNAVNYGGQPWIPDGPNPMAGGEVF
ncbi:MAG TPA: phage BR0599 family protein, partial [Oleiagrimonas sp.]|nr:phage BR0599 family protein [Oleiagrimonas sp.]